MGIIKSFSFVLLFVAIGCTSTYCRGKKDITPVVDLGFAEEKTGSDEVVFVYKEDGSLQCGMGQPVPLDRMAEELKDLTVVSSRSQHDGKMRMQVCGAATGQVNIYEIKKSDLEKAESRGFKVFTE